LSKLESLGKIGSVIIALLAMHFYPDYWIHILVAVPAALLIDHINRYSGKYAPLKSLQRTKEKFRKYKMKMELHRILKQEQQEDYQKQLISYALEKVKSIDESERKVGFEQLSQFGAEDVYEKLLQLLKTNELDKSHEKQVVETLYKTLSNMDKQ
jgi:hypothetical protein